MCARFTLRTPVNQWVQAFFEAWQSMGETCDDFTGNDDASVPKITSGSSGYSQSEFSPRFNVAPMQSVWAILNEQNEPRATPAVAMLDWGLVPSWSVDRKIASQTINARCETAAQKPAFRNAFANRHCVVPADGYLEWTTHADGKQPYLFERERQQPFFMAGLWESNTSLGNKSSPLRTCTVLTTQANSTARLIHDRMPILLDASDAAKWLAPSAVCDQAAQTELLRPADDDFVSPRMVARRINSVRNDDEACLKSAPIQHDLF